MIKSRPPVALPNRGILQRGRHGADGSESTQTPLCAYGTVDDKCERCKCLLSRYNDSTLCAPCRRSDSLKDIVRKSRPATGWVI
jgi:hypothetical protein